MTDGTSPYSELPVDRHITYQQRMKYCSRTSCTSCRSGTPSHGPYWYASWREGGRVRSRYLGKQAPPDYEASSDLQQPIATNPAPPRQQPHLRIRTLGRLAVWRGAIAVPDHIWNRKKVSALLGVLVSQPAYRLHREQICELLWPNVSADVAENRLWSTLRQLRRILDVPDAQGSHLSWRGDQLVLIPGDETETSVAWMDATEFEYLAARALAGRNAQACRQAIEVYGGNGDYLPEFAYEEWAIRRREQLRDRLIAVLVHGATLSREDGDWDTTERYLTRILEMDACHEQAACALMVLLKAQGRIPDGLRAYGQLEIALEQLGVEPSLETQRLRDQLNEASRTPVAQAVLPPRAEPAAFTNLPPQVSSFAGRKQEQATVSVLLQTSRLVTLTGIGGVGKTRLALAVASTRVDAYQDGVWLVDLATLPVSATSRTMLVCQTVARAFGLLEKIGEPLLQTLTEFLRPREILLVLDSCEHLIPECADLIQALLAHCPRLAVLATSRELLNIAGEAAWPVPPLAVPDANLTRPEDVLRCEAVQLFVARAQAKQPEFALTHANALTVAHICRKLDGIPLSLELAAARLTMFSLEQIAARLDDRLRLLTGGSRTALPRHQTLRAALDWSYALLDEPERVLLRRLAVFAGGCDLDAIEAVCAGGGTGPEMVEDAISSLVHKSLLLVRTQEDRAWYRLLDTVRQYSQEHLAAWGEAEAIGERHCRWYVSLAEQARPQLRGAEQAMWLNRLELEHDNIRAALEWSVVHPDTEEYGLRLAGAIWQFWYMRDYQTEGRSWLQRVLATNSSESAAFRAEALNAAGSLAYLQSDYAEAERLLEESLLDARRLEDRVAEARALMNLATIASRQGDYETVLSRYEASLPIFVEHQDMPNAASALYNIGLTWLNVANYDNARQRLEESLQLFRSLRFNLGVAKALTNLASIMRYRGDIEQAELAMTEGMSCLLESGDLSYKGEALREMGAIAEDRGNYALALGYFRDALRLDLGSQDEPGCSEAMEEVAWVSVAANAEVAQCTLIDQDPAKWETESCTSLSRQARDAVEHAVKLLAASDKRLATCGQPRYPRQQIQHDARVRWLRSALGEDIFTQCWTAGQRLSHEGALDLAFGTFAHSPS